MNLRRPAVRVVFVLTTAWLAACAAPRRLSLPEGPGTVAAGFVEAFEQASAACRAVRTMTAEMRLSGRAGGQRLRGTLIGGFEPPDALRLEGVAPFGPPAFILVSRAGSSTLLLPRDHRVLTGASAGEVLEALAGVRLDPATLRGLVSGCVVASPKATAGRQFPGGWMAVDVAGAGAGRGTAYLRQVQGQWRVLAGQVAALQVEYARFEGGLPRDIALHSFATPTVSADRAERTLIVALRLSLSQVATNADIKPAAFEVAVPRDAEPLTLEELRQAGPLGERR